MIANYDLSDPDKMKLPAGITCGDCRHIHRCKMIYGHVETDTICDWSPSRFSYASTLDQAVAERNQAWEELRKIREYIGANPEESTFDEVVRAITQQDVKPIPISFFRNMLDNVQIAPGRLLDGVQHDGYPGGGA